jgi:O-antigen/teichoic acid export membrane protein
MVAGWMLIPFLSYIGTTYLVYIRDNRSLIILTFTNLIIHIILSYPLTKIFNLAGYMLSMLLSQVYLLYILKYKHNKK